MAGKVSRIGVLALQGDVREHEEVLDALGVDHSQVRLERDLEGIDGLIIPGGESSVIDKLSRTFGSRDAIRAAIRDGLPVLGTCAGLILLADTVRGSIDGQETFGGLPVTVQRNAFGGQVESFETSIEMPVVGGEPVAAAFIRAPLIVDAGTAEVIATLPSGEIVGVRHGNCVGISFHPEVVGEKRVHAWWLSNVVNTRKR